MQQLDTVRTVVVAVAAAHAGPYFSHGGFVISGQVVGVIASVPDAL